MIFKRQAKAPIRLRVYAGWSEALLVAHTKMFEISCTGSNDSMLMLRLHYVPGDHGSHDFGHRGRNGMTVTQRRGTGSTNVARRGCRDRRDRFLNGQKICHGSHGGIDLLKCAVVERGERNKTWRNVTYLNTTWSMSVAGRLVTRRQRKVCQGLSRSIKLCCGLPRCPNSTPQLEPEHGV